MSVGFRTNVNQGEVIPLESETLELGNSDRIRLKFGNYGIEVVESGERIRVSNLFSTQNGIRTNRTFAVVLYPTVVDPAFQKEHEAILNGQSIGIVFKNFHWLIDKRHGYFGEMELAPHQIGEVSVFGDIADHQPVVHVYALYIKKHGVEFHYASIAEVHHPDYLDLDDLKVIYGKDVESARVPNEHFLALLDVVKGKMPGS